MPRLSRFDVLRRNTVVLSSGGYNQCPYRYGEIWLKHALKHRLHKNSIAQIEEKCKRTPLIRIDKAVPRLIQRIPQIDSISRLFGNGRPIRSYFCPAAGALNAAGSIIHRTGAVR